MNMEVGLQVIIVVLLGILSLGLVWCIWQIRNFNGRIKAAFGNDASTTLEEQLVGYIKRVDSVDAKLEQLQAAYSKLSIISKLASQKISVVRFNPFGDTGGDQSFTLAVLDAQDSGYILTSIHGREGTRVYVKPIDYGTSKYQLSNEEKQALTQAAKRVPNFKEKDNGQKN